MSETPEQWMEKFGKAENAEQALSILDSALAEDPDYVPAIGCKATLLGQMGRHEEALPLFQRIAELAPGSGAAHYSVGLHLQILGRNEEALAAYDKAIEVDPKEGDAYVNRGRLRDEGGDPKAAIEDYDKALALNAEDPIALSNRGNSLMAVERLDEALESFDKALALDETNVAAKLGRCTALVSLGRIDEANKARPEDSEHDRGPVLEVEKKTSKGRRLVLRYFPQSHSNPGHLEAMAKELLDYCGNLEDKGPGLVDGVRIGFMWSMLTLREQGETLVLCEPAFGRHPFSELSYDVSFTLQTAVMIKLLHSITELQYSACTFADGIAVSPEAMGSESLSLYRVHDTNDEHITGWVAGADSEKSAKALLDSGQFTVLPTAALVGMRFSVVKTLSLPAGSTVKMEGHKLVSVLDSDGKEVWQQKQG